MKLFKTTLLAIAVTAIYSCGPGVTTVKPTNDNLNKYQSFSYLPNSAIEMPDMAMNDDVNTLVIQQINDRMMDAGYELDRAKPDLLVLVSTKIDETTGTTTDPVYASYGSYNRPGLRVNSYYNNFYYNAYNSVPTVVGYDTDTYNYKDGTLIIQLVDRKSNETVWKGVSSESIYNSGDTATMTSLVNTIFEEYPLMK
ncbi:protein of unknown function [Nonlabens sp. Hel1_33_55]|uniref:DUF4136 domain-containing protein n=1 Tax=Nonlabens sp. Hel1_33_55 TaxID=1336802 RepID=UPI000875BB08|nr:DUF4136 domain-containing protein [Nonlabens sp. Hel1_33_55]SCX89278.1 protein of unknown function [Nonlabens sp. Hel1_33_55]